jgi:carbonic anhydrase
MCELSNAPAGNGCLNRRSFLKTPAVAAAAGLLAGGPYASAAYADALTREQRDKMTPDEILAMMKRGNARFRKGEGSSGTFWRSKKPRPKANSRQP